MPSEFTSAAFGRELPGAMRRVAETDAREASSGMNHSALDMQEPDHPEAPGTVPRLLILRAASGSPVLLEELRDAGVKFDDVHIYDAEAVDNDAENEPACGQAPENEGPGETSRRQKETAGAKAYDYIVFASAAGVRAYFASRMLPAGAAVVCIGPSTAEEFAEHSDAPYLMPDEHTAEGVAKVICRSLERSL